MKDSLSLAKILVECKTIFQEDEAVGLVSFFDQKIRTIRLASECIYQQLLKLHDLAKKAASRSGAKSLERRQPKIKKLKELLVEHFQEYSSRGETTRVLIFVHLRASVLEVKKELTGMTGIRPREFIGQGSTKVSSTASSSSSSNGETIGLTQAEQAQILKQFHSGEYNVLIATSIAEEGLDIAEVDLIVLLDSVASPTRLVQRCGRTGRKRAGRIVLITAPSSSATSSTGQPLQGDDEDKLQQSYKSIRALNDLLKRASKTLRLWSRSPRMIPDNIATPNILYAAMKRDGMEVAPSSTTVPITNYFSALSKGDGEVTNGKDNITNKDGVEEEDLFAFDFGEVSTRQAKPITAFFSHNDTQSSTQLSSKSDKSKEIRKYAEIIDITMSQPTIEEVKLPPLPQGKDEKFSVTSHRKRGLRSTFFELDDDDIEDWEPFSLKTGSPKKSSASKLKTNKKESPVISSAVPSSSSNLKGAYGKELSSKLSDNQTSKKRWSFSSISDIKARKIKNMIYSCTKEDDFFQVIDDLCEKEPASNKKEDNKTKDASYDWRNEQTESFIEIHNFLDNNAPDPQISSSSKTPLKRYSPPLQNSSEDWLNDSMMTADNIRSSMNATKPPKPNKEAKVSIRKLKEVNEKRNRDHKVIADKVDTQSDFYWQEPVKVTNLVRTNQSNELICCICLDVGNRDKSRNAIHSSEEEEENSDSCSESENSPIVTCAGSCKQCFHPDCYGIGEDDDKEEEFDEDSKQGNIITCEYCQYQQKNKFAPKRSCVLCFQSSGLLKLSTCKQWFHPICVLFTAELTLTDDGRANNLSRLNPERNPLLCMICRQRGGAVVQCKYDDCMEAFHPYCLFNKRNGQMIVWKRKNEIRYDLYCMEHLNSIPSKHLMVSSLLPIKAKKSKSHIVDSEIDTPEQQFTPIKSKELISLTQMELLDTDEKEKQSSLSLSHLLLPRRINKKDGEKKRLKRNNEDQHRTDKDAERQRLKLLAGAREKNIYSKKFYNKHVKKCFDLEAEEGLASSEDEEREKVRKLAKRLVDDEAEVDDEEEDNSDHSSDALSGDFINNGPYTQPSPHRNRDEYAMYLNVDRMYYEKKSPQMPHDSAEIVTSVADLVLRKNHKMYYQTNQNVYSLENTPNLLESKKRGRNGGETVHSNTWLNEEHGRKRRKRGDRWSDSEASDVGSEANEEENLDQYDDSFVVDDDVIIYDTDYRESQDREEEEEEGKVRQVDEEEEHSVSADDLPLTQRHFAPVPPEQHPLSSSAAVSSRYSNLPNGASPPQALVAPRKALPITIKSNLNQVMERYQAEANTASTNRVINVEQTENEPRLEPSEPHSNGHTGKRVLSCSSRVLKVNSLKPMKSIEKEDEEKHNLENDKEKESSIVVIRNERSSVTSRLHSERSGHNIVGLKRGFREVEIEEND